MQTSNLTPKIFNFFLELKPNNVMKTKSIIALFVVLIFSACKNEQAGKDNADKKQTAKVENTKTQTETKATTEANDSIVTFDPSNYGTYVNDSYKDRSGGSDWVSVNVSPLSKFRFMVSVRSRADKMQPTCTFDAAASSTGPNELIASEFLGTMKFSFAGNKVTISALEGSQEPLLTYYCRGGGSLAGTYQKINEQLDQNQVDKTAYVKTLAMKGSDIEFFIEVKGNKLTIRPAGLKNDNKPITHNIEGYVSDSEIGDLNADGSPEIYIYTVSEGTGRFGDLIAYSVNNGKSMTQINLPKISENKEASEGYGGHDEFAIVENSLVRRYPVYKPDDANSNPTGGTKQIQYKLKPGEAMWQLEIDKVVSY